jgi:pimeloyl-ACP methyl ester carboxylesterase
MPDRKPAARKVVLVHGDWADASSWSEVIERLLKDGFKVTAVQMPLDSLPDDISRVRRSLSVQDGPTIVAGRPFGGAVTTGLGAEAPNVVGLVIAAFAPDKGDAMKALLTGDPQPPGSSPAHPDSSGYVWLDTEGVVKYFAQDLHRDKALVLAAVQKPIAASEVFSETPFGDPAWKFVPSWYQVSEQDMIPPDAERFTASRAKAVTTSVKPSHAATISHPKETTELIERAAREAPNVAVARNPPS